MSDKPQLDLSRLTPEQIKQLEEVLSNLMSSAKSSAERPAIAGGAATARMRNVLDLDHSSHASG